MEPVEEPGILETDSVLVRAMREDDLDDVTGIDAAILGSRRPHYFSRLLERALKNADLQISLVAEMEGRVVGFVVGTVYYGEFGVVETAATIDAIGIDPAWRRRHVGRALMRQLRLNLGALRVSRLRTEVVWDDFDLLGFFRLEGFAPSGRLCLERPLDPTSPET